MWKHFIAEYFSFSKKERSGVAILIVLIVLLIMLPFFYPLFTRWKIYDHTKFEKEIALLKTRDADSTTDFANKRYDAKKYQQYNSTAQKNYYAGKPAGELFYFDPNKATATEWKKLGVRDKTIATIQKYLSKGGKFYKPADISKIWGLHPNEVERLLPYVQIATIPSANYAEKKTPEQPLYTRAKYSLTIIDVNIADTTALIALPGIGSKLSQRILNFRDKLGGFYNIEQVGETFGLPDSTFQKIKPQLRVGSNGLRQININNATVDVLKSHPYIRYSLANAIVQYRSQHGNFATVADVKKIMVITEDIFNKAAPYLKVN